MPGKHKAKSESKTGSQNNSQLQLLATVIEQTSEGVAVADLGGVLVFVNRAFARMHGYEPEEVLGKHLSTFHSSDQLAEVERANEQIQKVGGFVGEISHVRRDGTPFLTMMHNTLLKDDSGKPIGMIGAIRDITQQKQAEKALRERTHRLQRAEYIAKMGFLDWNLRTNRVYLSDGVIRMFGLESGQDWEAGELSRKFVHPDDLPLVKEGLERACRGQGQYDIDHRIIRTDGKVIWVHAQAELHRDRAGAPLSLLSTLVVISDRKQAEQKLLFLGQLTEQVADSMLATDLDFKITYANPAFMRLFGYTWEEVLGKSPKMLNAEFTAEEIQTEIYQKVLAGEVWTGEMVNRKKDGSNFPCDLMVYPLVDEHGVIFAYAGRQRDVTERRQSEEKREQDAKVLAAQHSELQEKNAALRQVLEHIEQQRQDYKHNICREIEQLCLPVLQRAKLQAPPSSARGIDRLIKDIKNALERDIDVFQERLNGLTQRELEICDLIKDGNTSKEISVQLNLSPATVSTHRQRIRKKLGITGKGLNLSTLLRVR